MKIYLDIEQRSDEWRQIRLGIPTSSNFAKIVTPKKFDLSKGAVDYALRLVAERLLNQTSESTIENPWMEQGRILEADAVRQYEFAYDLTTIPVGFITTDDGRIGCSPDRLVASEKRVALEVKVPSPHVHLGYLLNGTADEYLPQVLGQIYVAELDHAELFSYSPQMPAALIKTDRDPERIAKLADALDRFTESLDEMTERARSMGVFQPAPRVVAPAEAIEAADLAKHFKKKSHARMIEQGFIG